MSKIQELDNVVLKERQRHTLPVTVHTRPGDQLRCTVQDRKTMRQYSYREEIGRELVIDTIVTFDIPPGETVLGLTNGIGGIFGKAVGNI